MGIRRSFVDWNKFTGEEKLESGKTYLVFSITDGTKGKPVFAVYYKKGDVVQFKGGSHYVSSTASKPASTGLSPGPAKITYTSPGSAHPWCLVTEDWATTHVWGWVDDGTFE